MNECEPVIISACLVGIESRHDGSHASSEGFLTLLEGTPLIPVCPEQLGGLPTPRPSACIQGTGDGRRVLERKARVLDEHGKDVTDNFLRGAEKVVWIAKLTGAKRAILKEKSPSCGVCIIKKDNKDSGGMGVTAAMLQREGIDVQGAE